MKRNPKMVFCGALFTVYSITFVSADAESSKVKSLQEIPLHLGMNVIGDFTPEGQSGAIFKAWRDNGNAHGYTKFVIVVPDAAKNEDYGAWNIVGIEDDPKHILQDSIEDNPHVGEDVVQSVRFARGEVDGAKASLLIVSTRDLSHMQSYYDAVPTKVIIYQLVKVKDGERVGSTPFVFRPVRETHPKIRYCNAELALSKETGMPLSATYEGSNKIDGCISPGKG